MKKLIKELHSYFEKQKELDQTIVDQHQLKRDLMPEKLLALHVELGEMLNDWGQFKFWKVSPEVKATLLEEYVDAFHFLLSIGNEIEFDGIYFIRLSEYEVSVVDQALKVFELVTTFNYVLKRQQEHNLKLQYANLLSSFLRLGELVGLTAEDVRVAYDEKNQVNYERQASGY